MRIYRYFPVLIVALLVTAIPLLAMAQAQLPVVTYGADLSLDQKETVNRVLGVQDMKQGDFTVLTITNEEERRYLKGVAPERVIGTRAISSSRVDLLPVGSGIKVETFNITWVTREMIMSAMTTAGVRDARAIAAAPFAVSGTAALTGIIKGFEKASGRKLSEAEKRAANEELVKTGELGEAIGSKEKATQLILRIKERVVQENVTDPQQIKQIIINVAGDLNINLTDKQIADITSLMQKISKLDLTINDIRNQLAIIRGQIENIAGEQKQVQSLLAQIWDFLQQLWERVQNYFAAFAHVFRMDENGR